MAADVPERPRPGATQDAGDALERAFRDHFAALYRHLYARVHSVADAEDLTGQVFLKAVRWLDGGHSPEQVRAWLFRCAATVLSEHWRQHYRRQSAAHRLRLTELHPSARGADDPEHVNTVRRAEALIAQLPSRYAEVLRLRFLEGRTTAEIARTMGLRLDHVRVLQYRALRAAAKLGRVDDGPAK